MVHGETLFLRVLRKFRLGGSVTSMCSKPGSHEPLKQAVAVKCCAGHLIMLPSVNASLLAKLQGALIWNIRAVRGLCNDQNRARSLGSCCASHGICVLCAACPACRIA